MTQHQRPQPLVRRPAPLGWLEPGVVLGGLLPAAFLLWDALSGGLGANPVKQATHQTGQLALTLLILSLACTPARTWLRWTWAARVRRALGLLAALYAALHFGLYLRGQDFALGRIWEDVAQRPFVTSGFAALLLLLALALTSSKASVRRLGFVRWTQLHRLVYLAAGLAALHYWWGVKKDHTGPLLAVLVLLSLGLARLRIPGNKSGRQNKPARPNKLERLDKSGRQ